MLRFLTAGESHGPALTMTLEGMVADVPLSAKDIAAELARRRHGYGRGTRMKFEQDALEILGGVRHGRTLGSPISLVIRNTEWPKWQGVMAVEAEDAEIEDPALTSPRPGHADLAAIQKYGYADARPALERASARETAARVAAGAICKRFLAELGVGILSHTLEIGDIAAAPGVPSIQDAEAIDASPLRCLDGDAEQRMVALIEECRRTGDTLGGIVEVIADGIPPGLGSHVHWDRKLDSRLAAAVMSIQAIKGVEIGPAFEIARSLGSAAHDEISYDTAQGFHRETQRSGGLEAGITTGQPLRIRAAMKPLSSLARSLPTVDVATKQPSPAITQRSDVCAVPAAGVVAESMVAFVVADAMLEKFGGDSLDETRRNLAAYRDALARI
jgi:chorismate synthase